MRNFVAVVGPRVAFLVALVTPLIPGTVSCAQSDMDDVKTVVAAYHAALSALDAPRMEALWVQDDSVMDIEPSDKSISLGWDAVKKNFESRVRRVFGTEGGTGRWTTYPGQRRRRLVDGHCDRQF